jgi:O-methyltransferase
MPEENTLLDDNRLCLLRVLAGMTARLPGVGMEVGCFQGGSLVWIAKHMPHRKVYGLDTFEGLPKEHFKEGECHAPGGFACGFDYVQSFVTRSVTNVELVRGLFPDSAQPLDLKQVAFCHLDIDYGEGTRLALEWLHPRLVPGGIVVLDDWDWSYCPGVTLEAKAFVERHPEYIIVPTVAQQALMIRHDKWMGLLTMAIMETVGRISP